MTSSLYPDTDSTYICSYIPEVVEDLTVQVYDSVTVCMDDPQVCAADLFMSMVSFQQTAVLTLWDHSIFWKTFSARLLTPTKFLPRVKEHLQKDSTFPQTDFSVTPQRPCTAVTKVLYRRNALYFYLLENDCKEHARVEMKGFHSPKNDVLSFTVSIEFASTFPETEHLTSKVSH